MIRFKIANRILKVKIINDNLCILEFRKKLFEYFKNTPEHNKVTPQAKERCCGGVMNSEEV